MQRPKEVHFKEGTFPAILKRERALRGWSQADVAERIGSDPKTVGRWERGLTFPSPYLCQRLSELFGKTVQELGLVARDRRSSSEGEAGAGEHDVNKISVQDNVVQSVAKRALVEPMPASPSEEAGNRHRPLRQVYSRTAWATQKRYLLFAGLLLVVVGVLWWPLQGVVNIWASGGKLPSSNPYTHQGTLALNDSLQVNTASGWSLSNNDEGQCFFAGGMYRIRGTKNQYMKLCLAAETYFNDFTYEVQMKVIAGDCGGLGFRSTFPQLYYLLVCQDGNYRFVRYDRDNRANIRIMVSGTSPLIHQGLNKVNILAVVAQGNSFKLYVEARN